MMKKFKKHNNLKAKKFDNFYNQSACGKFTMINLGSIRTIYYSYNIPKQGIEIRYTKIR